MALEKGYALTDIRDRYTILEKVHCGGQGNVVRAVRKEDGRALILKLYHEGEITSWDDFEKAHEGADKEIKFLERARDQGREGVPQIMEYGTFGALEQPYLAMEEVEGSTLESLLNKSGSNPTAEETLKLASGLAQTLNYAHKEAGSRPFVHRDLKPSSIIMTDKGQYVIIDWGTVKCGTGKTQFTTQFDSLYYTAPEVRFGEEITPSADVYSLAKILQHSLLGRRFIEKRGEVDRSDFAGLNVPDSFIDALLSAADDKAEKRPQSAAEFLQQLQKKELAVSNDSAMERVSSAAPEKTIEQAISEGLVSVNYDEYNKKLPITWKFLYTHLDNVEGHLLLPVGGLSITESVEGSQCAWFGAAINIAEKVRYAQGIGFGAAVNIAETVEMNQWAGVGAAINIAERVGSQFAAFGAAVNIAESVEDEQFAVLGVAVNIAKHVGGNQLAGLGAINYAKSVGRDQVALTGIAVNVAETVGGSQYGLVNVVTKELKKRQIGVINYANGSEFKQFGLLNFRPGKVWWNPEVSLFYYDRKKAVQAKEKLRVELEALVDEELTRTDKEQTRRIEVSNDDFKIELISEISYPEHNLVLKKTGETTKNPNYSLLLDEEEEEVEEDIEKKVYFYKNV
ncbi:MAG: serine/threonine-protein kinase [Nanoarchaeota archaeon]